MVQNHRDIAELVGAYPTCNHCNSKAVVRDAWASWDFIQREWVLKSVFDHFACDKCGSETTPVWKIDKEFRKKRIRRLNDALRKGQSDVGSIVVTSGIQALGPGFLLESNNAVIGFDAFTQDNDPHLEHDFGALEVAGEKLFFKIDYFDLAMRALSPDPANPAVTTRVMTVMLAGEY